MPDETLIEQRLAAVEVAVSDLRRRMDELPASPGWLDKVIGSITDDAAFLKALEHGRQYRASDRPGDEAEGGP